MRTTYRRAYELQLSSYRPATFIPLGPQHRRHRLQWCHEHADWTPDQWQSVVWSDESRFCMDFHDGRVRIRRFPNQRYHRDMFVYHDRYGGGSVMIWGAFSWSGLSQMVVVQGTLNSQQYVDQILHPVLLPFFHDNAQHLLFQQDNARPHIAAHSLDFLGTNHINLLPWPARSPDLSPIEHLWDAIGRQLHDPIMYPDPPATIAELRQRILDQWHAIRLDLVHNLIGSISNRIQLCIQQRGGPTRY